MTIEEMTKPCTQQSLLWTFGCLFTLFSCLLLHADWEEEQVSSPNILRLIYQGRFLHGNVTLGGEETHAARTNWHAARSPLS